MFPTCIETDRLLLRPIEAGDAQAIFETYAQDAQVARFTTWRPHHDVSETQAFVARCLAIARDESPTYAITGRGDGAFRGVFELRQPTAHRLGFGYVLARQFWCQGFMSEALSAACNWALGQSSIWRIGDVCDVENLASARVMEKAGLKREGLLRRWMIHPALGSEPRDCFSYAKAR